MQCFSEQKNQENFLTCLFNHTCPILQLFSELKIKIIHRPFICSYMLSFAMVFRTKKSGQFLDLSMYSLLLAQFCNCFQNKKSKIIIDQFIYSQMLNSAILFRTKKCQKNSLTCLFTPTGPILQWFSEQKIKKIHRPFFYS